MWILFAVGSAAFAGLTSILAKCGIKKTDSTLATAIRTIVVLIFSWIMVFIVHSQNEIYQIDTKTLFFLILSGLSVLFHWNLQYGIDILFFFFFLISSVGIISALIVNLIFLI